MSLVLSVSVGGEERYVDQRIRETVDVLRDVGADLVVARWTERTDTRRAEAPFVIDAVLKESGSLSVAVWYVDGPKDSVTICLGNSCKNVVKGGNRVPVVFPISGLTRGSRTISGVIKGLNEAGTYKFMFMGIASIGGTWRTLAAIEKTVDVVLYIPHPRAQISVLQWTPKVEPGGYAFFRIRLKNVGDIKGKVALGIAYVSGPEASVKVCILRGTVYECRDVSVGHEVLVSADLNVGQHVDIVGYIAGLTYYGTYTFELNGYHWQATPGAPGHRGGHYLT